MNKSIVEEVKAEALASAKAKQALQPKSTPWYINLLMWVLDVLAAVAVLALAVQGALSLLQTNLGTSVKLGIAALVVGLLATRLLERVFKK